MRRPKLVRRLIRALTKLQLPSGYDIDTHFKPRYNPWEQRLCAVPDGDLFKAIRKASASVVTARIARFTERGILLESGSRARGRHHRHGDWPEPARLRGHEADRRRRSRCASTTRVAYKSMMLSGVPNFAFAVGYTNSSWTLKIDLVCEHLCRILARMDAAGNDTVMAILGDDAIERRPLLDFQAGYVQRAIDGFPTQGSHGPWTLEMSYKADRARLRHGPVEDPALRFATSTSASRGRRAAA